MLCYLFSELSRKMVQELSSMTFHWNILKGPQLTFRKNWFARHSKYHSIPRPRKAVPVGHHLHLNSDKWETCFIIGFHGTDNSLTPGVMAISCIISPFDIILRQPWYQPESGYNHLLDIYKQDDHMNELMQQDGKRRGHQNILCVTNVTKQLLNCLKEGEFMRVTQGFAVRFPLHSYCASSLLQNNTIIKTLSSFNTTIWKTQLGCIEISGKFINFMYTKILKPDFTAV